LNKPFPIVQPLQKYSTCLPSQISDVRSAIQLEAILNEMALLITIATNNVTAGDTEVLDRHCIPFRDDKMGIGAYCLTIVSALTRHYSSWQLAQIIQMNTAER